MNFILVVNYKICIFQHAVACLNTILAHETWSSDVLSSRCAHRRPEDHYLLDSETLNGDANYIIEHSRSTSTRHKRTTEHHGWTNTETTRTSRPWNTRETILDAVRKVRDVVDVRDTRRPRATSKYIHRVEMKSCRCRPVLLIRSYHEQFEEDDVARIQAQRTNHRHKRLLGVHPSRIIYPLVRLRESEHRNSIYESRMTRTGTPTAPSERVLALRVVIALSETLP